MFNFIINPNDFGQSVENLFYLSFLIRDGTCAMELDEKTLAPMICDCRQLFSLRLICLMILFLPLKGLCERPSEDDYADGTLKKRQVVMELDVATWRVRTTFPSPSKAITLIISPSSSVPQKFSILLSLRFRSDRLIKMTRKVGMVRLPTQSFSDCAFDPAVS